MFDVIIIGAGPAGLTAALYCLRSGKSTLILEKETIGGQISLSPRVENFPSIKAISGSEFSDRLFEQVTQLGAEFELDRVTNLVKDKDVFEVTTEYSKYEAKSVIIATGVQHRHIGVEGEDELVGKGVSYCAVCDGAFYKGEEVALIGDANSALQYALLLSNYCKRVTVCTLFDSFFGDKLLVDRLLERENVTVYHNLSLHEFCTNNGELSGLHFINTADGNDFNLDVKAVFIAIGQIPNNEVFRSLAELDSNGYIISDERCSTKTEGLFVAGDARTKSVRQLTTAVGDGAVSAVSACRYLDR